MSTTASSRKFFQITPSDDAADNFKDTNTQKAIFTRAVSATVEGVQTVIDVDGNEVPIFLFKGYNPIVCARVKTGGVASDLWAFF